MCHIPRSSRTNKSLQARRSLKPACVLFAGHLLVRCSHWLNVPILLGLILSGLSICSASPVYHHKQDPVTGNFVLL